MVAAGGEAAPGAKAWMPEREGDRNETRPPRPTMTIGKDKQ